MSYPFADIEARWQAFWSKQKSFRTPTDRSRPKYYVLDMFPYPSGAGLHVGHPEGYTATDIMARYKRMRGFNVLHPMGWDAFGLPAERYAMKTGVHPSETTAQNVANFRRQLQALGFSYDWEREISTTDVGYYKWTQWIFLKIFNSFFDETQNKARPIQELKIPEAVAGDPDAKEEFINQHRLAYIKEAPVNWCAELGTVLANEEVEEWTSKGYKVERKPMRQWMLRITAYAARLLDGLEGLDWPAGTMELQKNWIGRSEGAEVDFPLPADIQAAAAERAKNSGDADLASPSKQAGETPTALRVFTTRPDTLFGVTYMVLAPEHPLVAAFTTPDQAAAVESYVEQAALKSELDRTVQGEKAEKTGVFTGGYVSHAITAEPVPVWISDYVLMSYGTGAIMSVPAHDERDFAFAKKFKLPILPVITKDGKPPAGALSEAYTGPGKNINSDFLNGLGTDEAKAKMIAHLEKNKSGAGRVNYKLRDWLFSRQRYWGEPMPINFDERGHLVPENEGDLPLELPPSDNFQPAATGESPLANLTDWVNHERDGKKLRRETNTMPQWAGSCWYYLRYIDPENQDALVDPAAEDYWMGENGVDLYVGGSEHAVLHLLYARFWHKILFDLGVVKSSEPFRKLVHQGLILAYSYKDQNNQYYGEHETEIRDGKSFSKDGDLELESKIEKMSKSLGNVVNPDDVVSEYGADAFRLYEMFLGPLEQSKPWSTRGIEGVFRFLNRVWRLYTELEDGETHDTIDPRLLEEPAAEHQKSAERMLHATIQKVGDDIERMSFNTAISQMMVCVNEFFARKQMGRWGAESFALLLAPFAPHMAEELWRRLGKTESLTDESWPLFDAAKTASDEFEAVFQVNGKVRGKAMVAAGTGDDELKAAALADEGVIRNLDGKEPKKIIVVKNKLVNIVVGK
ncbi:MAG: leucine--tRNA ligase [Leptospirales bacterium]